MNIEQNDPRHNSALAGALEMARRGFKVFPLSAKDQPRGKWREGCTADAATINAWDPFNLYAVCFDPGQFAIDLDVKNGKDGIAALAMLEVEHGDLPATLIVKTPSGGAHLYFQGDGAANSVEKDQDGIDVRADGGYCVGPGSVGYTVECNIETAQAPAWLLAKVQAPVRDERKAAENIDVESAISRAATFLATRDPAIEGKGGDDWTLKTVFLVRDLGVPEAKVPEVLAEWNGRCVPPWEAGELKTKIENAYRYGENEPGADATRPPQEAFADALKALPAVSDTPGVVPVPVIDPVPFDTLVSRPSKPIEELIPGLVERGIATMLAGPGGTHKSRVALEWGLCLHAGKPVYGREVTPATFIYLDFENGSDEVARRAQSIAKHHALPNLFSAQYYDFKTPFERGNGDVPVFMAAPALAKVSDEGIDVTPFYHTLYARLKAIPGHKFIVADSTYNVLRFTGNAKINETAVKAALNLLDYLCAATDSTMVYLWHPSQAGLERGDASGWSVAWHNTPRARLSLSDASRKWGTDAFALKVEKRNNGPAGKEIILSWKNGVLVPRVSAFEAEDKGQKLVKAVTKIAIDASMTGQFINKKHKLFRWQIEEIKSLAGEVQMKEIAEALEQSVAEKHLQYREGRGHDKAGYMRGDLDLANVKHHGVEEAMRLADLAAQRDLTSMLT